MMGKRYHKWFGLGLILLMIWGISGDMNALAGEQLFTLDAARYRQRGGLVYLEIYFLIQRDQLQFVKAADGYEAGYEINVEIHSCDSLFSSSSWEVVDHVLRLEDITPRQKLPDIAVYNLFPGEYTIKGSVIDINQNVTYSRSLDMTLGAFLDSQLSISDIELATKLQKDDQESKFHKNGFLVIPNPEQIYGTSLPMLYYYSEIYNLDPDTGRFSVERIILDETQNVIKRLPLKRRAKVGKSAVEVDGFSVVSLKSGTYYLQLNVEDHDTEKKTSNKTKFFVYRPADFLLKKVTSVPLRVTSFEMEIQSYNDEELEEAAGEIKYLLNESQWRSVKKLNSDGRRTFLVRFWRERDPDPATEVNEFRQLFVERKEYADQKYGMFGRLGWKTDKGRIYILYGTPSQVDYHPHDQSMRSYEIWYYDNIEGGVQFAFLDRNNLGDYRLVHSTKKGELYRPNWMQQEATVHKQQY